MEMKMSTFIEFLVIILGEKIKIGIVFWGYALRVE